jgi:cysteinyl-tRNA synthetase
MLASEKGLNRLLEGVKLISTIQAKSTSSFSVSEWIQNCYDAMNDDFNTPILIANLFEGVRYINLLNDNSASLTAEDLKLFSHSINTFAFDVLGLKDEKSVENNNEKLEGVINMLIDMRNEARANKDFALSDQIRNRLIALGIQLKDGKEGTSFSIQ